MKKMKQRERKLAVSWRLSMRSTPQSSVYLTLFSSMLTVGLRGGRLFPYFTDEQVEASHG